MIEISSATGDDDASIKSLLAGLQLPTAGVDEHLRSFVVARDGADIVGVGGVEIYSSAALLRSIAVDPSRRSEGVAQKVIASLLDTVGSRGIRELYLLTTTAESYFVRLGFAKIQRDQAHGDLLQSREFQDACPATATCMRLVLS